ncbi:MAG TPA: BTAD domain-containing putative transcriptional regulator [Pseudonocardia sp.]|jgi:DNA-binding SARP family transcriptional activator/tetratricopeptide (TPR) repeat protein|uniref:AfsR/SARP family transcriptional regulator n=1 Tax=Pseudonocardia sp. TaxID=60912 RepID=UPI002B4B4237|nr:BTAD domain-containing putative transcriptional regulator [Pseudonocardia sp.]HLU57068.1 BTAD domain-containing putative transcriptional regulator [Pseudonocardia sp.]
MRLRFTVLGPVEAHQDGHAIDLGSPRQRNVLGALLIDVNNEVPTDELAIRIWGDDPPLRAAQTLQSYLSRLRSALPCEIHRGPGGYAVRVDEDAVDLHRFRRLTAGARGTDDASAAALLSEALACWRGPLLAGLDTPWAVRLRGETQLERLAAELDLVDVRLRRGEHASVLAELTALADEHPLDERIARQLLLALYRSGRQAEALRRYEEVRVRLADELGADPGPALQKLHREMLTGAPSLDHVEPARAPAGPVPRQLPAPPAVFTGRQGELAALDAALDDGRPVAICAVGGTGGVGKTSLALHWAHRNLDRFPDGQLYVNLRGFDGGFSRAAEPLAPDVAIRTFLDGLGVEVDAIPPGLDAQAALYRSLVAGRRMLVLLDNARDTEQVAPLLPGSPGCAVLVTSRRQLGGLVAVHGARSLPLDVLPDAEARALLAGHLGRERLDAEPDAVDAVLRACAGLPLALAIVAARASTRPHLPLAAVAEELQNGPGRLDALDAGDARADLRSVFSWSYRALRPEAARLFRRLGLHPGPDVGLPAAAGLAGVDVHEVRPLLAELTGASLLTEHRPGRFVLHDLLRAYAAERGEAEDTEAERRATVRRLLDHYLHSGVPASLVLTPTRTRIDVDPPAPGVTPEVPTDLRQATEWFATERPAVLAAIRLAAQHGFDTHCWQLEWTIGEFLDRHAHWHDYAEACTLALDAARRLGSPAVEAIVLRGLARACTRLDAHDEAYAHLERALELYRQLGDPAGQAAVHIGFGRLLEPQGRHTEALAHAEQALELARAGGDRAGEAFAWNGVGWCHARLGNYERTIEYAAQALRVAGEVDGCPVAGMWHTLGYAHLHLGHHQEAIDCFRRSVRASRETPDVNVEVLALGRLGDAQREAGDLDAARASWQEALAIQRARGRNRAAETIERKLADAMRNP